MREDSRDREKHLAIHSLFTAIQQTFESMLVASRVVRTFCSQAVLKRHSQKTALALTVTVKTENIPEMTDCEFRWE